MQTLPISRRPSSKSIDIPRETPYPLHINFCFPRNHRSSPSSLCFLSFCLGRPRPVFHFIILTREPRKLEKYLKLDRHISSLKISQGTQLTASNRSHRRRSYTFSRDVVQRTPSKTPASQLTDPRPSPNNPHPGPRNRTPLAFPALRNTRHFPDKAHVPNSGTGSDFSLPPFSYVMSAVGMFLCYNLLEVSRNDRRTNKTVRADLFPRFDSGARVSTSPVPCRLSETNDVPCEVPSREVSFSPTT